MDIEERAEKYAQEHTPIKLAGVPLYTKEITELRALMTAAYLAGSAQTQADYTAQTHAPWGDWGHD